MEIALLASAIIGVIVVTVGIVYCARVRLSSTREQRRPFALGVLIALECILLGILLQRAHYLGWVLSGDNTSDAIFSVGCFALSIGATIALFVAIAKAPHQAHETDTSRPQEPAR